MGTALLGPVPACSQLILAVSTPSQPHSLYKTCSIPRGLSTYAAFYCLHLYQSFWGWFVFISCLCCQTHICMFSCIFACFTKIIQWSKVWSVFFCFAFARQTLKGPGQQNTGPVMTEVCPTPSLPPGPSQIPAQEMKKTISLPDNCREWQPSFPPPLASVQTDTYCHFTPVRDL